MVRHGKSLPLFADEDHHRPLRYSSRELSQQLIQNAQLKLDSNNIPPTIRDELSYGLPEAGTDARTELYMLNYFQIMDELFFFNLVGRHVNMYYDYEPNFQTHGYFQAHRQTWTPDRRVRDLKIVIQMRSHRGTYREQLRSLIGTLSHELLHAFLDIYSCSCSEQCHKRIEARKRIGLTGHGEAWCNAMRAIEITIKTWRGFEDLDLVVWFHESLEADAQKNGMMPGIPGMPVGFGGFPGLGGLFGGLAGLEGMAGIVGGMGGEVASGGESNPGGSDGEIESVRPKRRRRVKKSGRGEIPSGSRGRKGNRGNRGNRETPTGEGSTGVSKKRRRGSVLDDYDVTCYCTSM